MTACHPWLNPYSHFFNLVIKQSCTGYHWILRASDRLSWKDVTVLPCYWLGNTGSERLANLSRVTQWRSQVSVQICVTTKSQARNHYTTPPLLTLGWQREMQWSFHRHGGRCLGWVGILKESESKMEEVSEGSYTSPYSRINSGIGIHK